MLSFFQLSQRFNRTIKEKIQRYFTENRTKRWLDVLDQFVAIYNSTYHETIGMPPNEVSSENSARIRERIYGNLPKAKCSGLKPGDKVRHGLVDGHLNHDLWSIDHVYNSSKESPLNEQYSPKDIFQDGLMNFMKFLEYQNLSTFATIVLKKRTGVSNWINHFTAKN